MRKLYLLYDGDCALCRRLRDWLYEQPHWLELDLLLANSDAAKRLFPSLASGGRPEELVVVTDEGHYYKGNHAWIMCLYALTEYRDWAYRLAQPLLLPLARQAFEALSHNRARISRWLRADEAEIARELEMIKPSCDLPVGNKMKDYLE
jgi:predicted DCC family thiol-disulfide oxidoreductase YuxK